MYSMYRKHRVKKMYRKKTGLFWRTLAFFYNVPCSQFDNPDRYAVTTLLLSRSGDQQHQQLVFVQGDCRSRCRRHCCRVAELKAADHKRDPKNVSTP
jgi:hypothetical protein